MSYELLDVLEDVAECLIMAAERIVDFLCPLCNRETVHHVFRENPDGSYDEVARHCKKCDKNV